MNSYKVLVQKETELSLTPVRLYDNEAEIVFDDFDEDGNEVYDVDVNGDIDTILDQCAGVISYEKIS